MDINYLILAHTNLSQLDRLVKTLSDERTRIFIHVDKKVRVGELQKFDFYHADRVEVLAEPLSIRWGGFNMVQATLMLMKAALRSSGQGYFILLSGQDYPIKSNRFIADCLRQDAGREYMTYWPIPSGNWSGGGLNRIRYAWFVDEIGFTASRLLYYLQRLVRAKRSYTPAQSPFGGSQWWCLTDACIKYIAAFVEANPAFLDFYRHTLIADEMFFQTIVLNSPFRDQVVNDHLHHLEFDGLSKHPTVITMKDLAGLLASHNLWARKFDNQIDQEVILELERRITR